jgi:hypothetical protein
MADISMCTGLNCPLKENCYRHKATPGIWQSYFTIPPYIKELEECDSFWEMKNNNADENTDI